MPLMCGLTFKCCFKASKLALTQLRLPVTQNQLVWLKPSRKLRRSMRARCATMQPKSISGRAICSSCRTIRLCLVQTLTIKSSKFLNARFWVSESTWKQLLFGSCISTLRSNCATWASAFYSVMWPPRHLCLTMKQSAKSKNYSNQFADNNNLFLYLLTGTLSTWIHSLTTLSRILRSRTLRERYQASTQSTSKR